MTSTRIPAPSKNSHPPAPPPPSEPWTIEAARTLYNIEGWGIGFIIRDLYDRSFDSDLNIYGRPVEAEGSPWAREKLPSLSPLVVGIEHEAPLVVRLEQYNPDARAPVFTDGAEGHRGGIGKY